MNTIEVTEVTRSGRVIHTARFMVNRVLALVEFPAADAAVAQGGEGRSTPSG